MTLEDPPREPIHQSFIGEKGTIPTHVVYFERIPGKLTGINSTDLQGALNEDSGILAVSAQYISRDGRHVTD